MFVTISVKTGIGADIVCIVEKVSLLNKLLLAIVVLVVILLLKSRRVLLLLLLLLLIILEEPDSKKLRSNAAFVLEVVEEEVKSGLVSKFKLFKRSKLLD